MFVFFFRGCFGYIPRGNGAVKPVERLYLRRSLYSFALQSSKPSPEMCRHCCMVVWLLPRRPRSSKRIMNRKTNKERFPPLFRVLSARLRRSWYYRFLLFARKSTLLKGRGRTATGMVSGTPAVTAVGVRSSAGGVVMASLPVAAARFVGRQSLHDAVSNNHSAVDRKVPADHKGTHGGIFLGEDIRLVRKIRLILPAVHKDVAGVAARATVAFVHGVSPSTTAAKTFQVLDIEASHCDRWASMARPCWVAGQKGGRGRRKIRIIRVLRGSGPGIRITSLEKGQGNL